MAKLKNSNGQKSILGTLRTELNEVKTKHNWEADTWIPELQSRFQLIKDLFTDPAGGCRAYPMALGEPGAGVHTDHRLQ